MVLDRELDIILELVTKFDIEFVLFEGFDNFDFCIELRLKLEVKSESGYWSSYSTNEKILNLFKLLVDLLFESDSSFV